MLEKYQTYLVLILYLLTLNVSSEEQFNSNNAQLCNTDNIEQHIEDEKVKLEHKEESINSSDSTVNFSGFGDRIMYIQSDS